VKIFVTGLRGFPNVQGGVERHCENLFPYISKKCQVIVSTRKFYIKNPQKEWKNIKFVHLWAPHNKFLEAFIHTFLSVIYAYFLHPDILHIHAIGPSLFVPFAKFLGMKVVMTHHGPDYERKKWNKFAKLVLKLGEFLGVKFADKVIVISQNIKESIEANFNRHDLIKIPNGINIKENMKNNEKYIKKYKLKKKKYIFTALRFVPEKGIYDLIKAYELNKKTSFKLIIAGDADHETEYSLRIKEMAKKISGVILTGFITGEELESLYANAGLFVLPSYYEGLPIALLEALSYGLPVLVSDIPPNREIPLPEYRYFQPGNIEELSEKMNKLIRKGISRTEKNKIFRILKKEYNWKKIAEKTYSVYQEIL